MKNALRLAAAFACFVVSFILIVAVPSAIALGFAEFMDNDASVFGAVMVISLSFIWAFPLPSVFSVSASTSTAKLLNVAVS